MQKRIKELISDSMELKKKLINMPDLLSDIEKASSEIVMSLQNGHKLLLAGNGGSAADAQHIAAEFVNKFNFDRPGLPAIALTTDTSVITSVSNDSSFNQIFARQISALGNEGDVFIGISTSGKSANIVEALISARSRKLLTISITGSGGGSMKGISDICIAVPSTDTPRIQEVHILIGHIICDIVEMKLFGNK